MTTPPIKTKTTTSARMIARLQDLYFSESKPEDLTPIDVALLTYLILRQADDHFVYDSQETLGARLGCDRRTVARSIERLAKLKWLTVEQAWDFNEKNRRKTRAMYAPSGLSVNLDELPTDRARRSAPSEDAKNLAGQHTAVLVQSGVGNRYKRTPRRFERHQEHAAQRLIDEVGYDAIVDILNFALESREHQKAALTSLYAIRQRLKRIRADMAERKVCAQG